MDVFSVTELHAFFTFLEGKGLRRLREVNLTDRLPYDMTEYGNGPLLVQVEYDRGFWNCFIADAARPEPAYDVHLVTMLLGHELNELMPIRDQLAFVRANWDEIVARFAPDRLSATHELVAQSARERARRRAPIWPRAVRELSAFLESQGLTCQLRNAPDGWLGSLAVQYGNADVAVRMRSQDRWVIYFSDPATGSGDWYSVALIMDLLEGLDRPKIKYPAFYDYVKAHWTRIADLFSPSRRRATHETLRRMQAQAAGRR